MQMHREIHPMKHKPTSLILSLFAASLCLTGAGLSGCNTVKGAGQDLKSAGQAIERKARAEKVLLTQAARSSRVVCTPNPGRPWSESMRRFIAPMTGAAY
jgi:predicted small secreted protein